MTPERIAVIKEDAQYEVENGYGHSSSDISNQEALELLAALEEAQQQLSEAKEINAKWALDALFKDETEVERKLAEAQQTIARQREALQSIYEESEDRGARACAAEALGEI